jgi:hypothetical protein
MVTYTLQFAKDGTASKTVEGIVGADCLQDAFSQQLDQALGKIDASHVTTEFYACSREQTHEHQKGAS